VRRAVAEGHELGNHTFDHIDVQHEPDDGVVQDQLARTSAVLEQATGVTPRFVRPPYGKDACRTARIGAEVGLEACVLWSTMVWDWDPAREADWIVARILGEARAGSIVLLHDGAPPGEAPQRDETVAAVAAVVPALVARGFELVTVSELLAT
jgi:peptidoglycan/xylan/chitin deacetylase (PgdA/CDA1 family)